MRCILVAGARPQFIKAAALLPALREQGEALLVHTGQHTVASMVDAHFEGLELSPPDLRLVAPDIERSERLDAMATALTSVLEDARPDWVVVVGDADSTVAGARAAVQLNLRVAHVEAGARSGEPDLPEERNRIEVDVSSTLLLCSTDAHAKNIEARDGVHVVGDVMADVLLAREAQIRAKAPGGAYGVLTLHRAATADDAEAVQRVVDAAAAGGTRILFPRHPRTAVTALPDGVELQPPLPYLDFLGLVAGAQFVLTDSGGLQKEAYLLGVPCITLRDATEWGETVDAGWNVLVGTDGARIKAALQAPPRGEDRPALYGDGSAALRVARCLIRS